MESDRLRAPSATIANIKNQAKKVGRPLAAAIMAFSGQVYGGGPSEVKADDDGLAQQTLSSQSLEVNPFGPTGPDIGIPFHPALSEQQIKEAVFALEFQDVMRRAEQADLPAFFSPISYAAKRGQAQLMEDLKVYYPIYKAVGDKFGHDWFLIWIIHEVESLASQHPDVVNGTSYHIGAGQRAPGWSESVVDEASSGLEYLALLPQRLPNDWRELAFTGWHLRNVTEDGTVLGSLREYSAAWHGELRYIIFLDLKKIFDAPIN
ncbi:MAG: hypothetical protein Q7S45_04020 [Candidatus Curtissbacteria bacterium]|nr:hypothetical protein [Candidatus Curtissbacteria bacterium]